MPVGAEPKPELWLETSREAKREFFGTPTEELATLLGGSGRARIPWRLVRRGVDPFAPGALAEGARRRLAEACRSAPLEVADRSVGGCGTTKLVLRARDGEVVETVLIPFVIGPGSRTTVCVSSQVGCARACTFCVTATVGLRRQLDAAEIVDQVRCAFDELRARDLPPLRNLVLMGMGEPLDNLDEVRRALAVITDPFAFGIGRRRITVSTVGTSPSRVRAAHDLPGHLAWSLHSADPSVRAALVPTDRATLDELRAAFLEVVAARDEDLFIEITLMRDVNDGEHDARAMAAFLAPFGRRARVNLLPLNPGRPGLSPAPPERAERYRQILMDAGHLCIIRRARGAEMAAACGQLAAARRHV